MKAKIIQWSAYFEGAITPSVCGKMKVGEETIIFKYPHSLLESEEVNAQMMRLVKIINDGPSV